MAVGCRFDEHTNTQQAWLTVSRKGKRMSSIMSGAKLDRKRQGGQEKKGQTKDRCRT